MTGFMRTLLASTLTGLALVVSGCAADTEELRTIGETEGIYVDVGGLRYQVQISRILNPEDPEDGQYLAGVPEAEAPEADEAWFGVFMRVANTTSEATHDTAEEFELVDSDGNTYEPVEIDAEDNPFVYEPATLGPGELLPEPNTAAAEGPIKGALVLFKPTLQTLQNRPIELEIHSPEGEDPDTVGVIDLDV